MQTNEKLLKDFYKSFKIKERDYSLYCLDNIEGITMKGMPSGGMYVGIESVFEEYFPNMLSNFEEFHAEPTEFLDIDDKVIVFERYHGQTKIGKKFIIPFCHLYAIKDNKIFRFEQYTNTQIIKEGITG